MDKHCNLDMGEVFEDYDCLLNFVDKKSDKFYCIQVLKNNKGFHIWTRWGKNGTDGLDKLDGPVSQAEAEKDFKKKFMDKTKNEWDKQQQFSAVKGKYTLIQRCCLSQSENLEKPTLPDEVLSGRGLPADIVYVILYFLPTRDILRCMQVCKSWKAMLSEKYFWKKFIQRHFDLSIKSDISNELGPLNQWSNPEDWYCYFENEEDSYVIRPFPSVWNCGVVHPAGLDPMSGDVSSLQAFSRSLEILVHIREEVTRLDISSGTQCSANEGEDRINVVLFPWKQEKLPVPLDILDNVFHFHPEIFEYYTSHPKDIGEQRNEQLYFHIRPISNSDNESDEDHDLDEKPCLNRLFGMSFFSGDEMGKYEATRKFYEWLQPIMVPSVTVYAGEDKLNPVVVFMLTKLAPGWVGGALTAVNYT